MDESAYRDIRETVDARGCAFEKALLESLQKRHGAVADLPYSAIMPAVAACEARPRRGRPG